MLQQGYQGRFYGVSDEEFRLFLETAEILFIHALALCRWCWERRR